MASGKSKETRGLKAWGSRISGMELPALSSILKDLNRITDDTNSDADQLADVILKDASLTSQVLRVANSVQYNPAAHSITTISRAVVLIGYSEIKHISLSVMVIDTLLGKNPNSELLEVIARSFHAAVQAKNMAAKLEPEQREEIFIAALLHHLGEMAFLGCGGDQVDDYLAKMDQAPQEQQSICLDVLGVGFNTITKELAREWDLGGLLVETLEKPKNPSRKVAAVNLGESISKAVRFGWESKEMKQVLQDVVKFTGLELDKVEELVLSGADEASTVASTYGADKVCHLIPGSGDIQSTPAEEQVSPTELQLKYLHELTDLVLHKADVNRIFATVVRGICRGVQIERVAIALFNGHRSHIEARYLSGTGTEEWRNTFRMPVVDIEPPQDVFSLVLNGNKTLWFGQDPKFERLRYNALKSILPMGECFVAPLTVGMRNIGVLYCDQCGRKLDKQKFKDFRLFVKQTNLALAMLVGKK